MAKKKKQYVFYCAYTTKESHTMQLEAYRKWCVAKNEKDGCNSYKSVVVSDDMPAHIYDYSNLGAAIKMVRDADGVLVVANEFIIPDVFFEAMYNEENPVKVTVLSQPEHGEDFFGGMKKINDELEKH